MQHTTVGSLGEGDILGRIQRRTGRARAAVVGVGDDAAVLASRGDVVVTTDTLVEGPDFRRAWSSGFDLGWKAAAVNLADVAAMGAVPTALVVALAVPNDEDIAYVEAIADGLREACDALAPGCAVAGGDLTQSPVLTVAVTAIGDLEGRDPVLRSGAAPGDVLAIAGEMGVAARGLAILFDRFAQGDEAQPVDLRLLADDDRRAVEMQLRPQPPVGLGSVAQAFGATAMLDVSDGLVLDARRLADASDVTLDIESQALGADPATALDGGEDHALLATFAPGALPPGFREIGRVAARGSDSVTVDGVPHRGRGGWDPYRDWTAGSGR